MKFECNFGFALFQEFSMHTEFEVISTSIGQCYIFPGLSKKSRSNAIVVSEEWTPLVLSHEFCQFGGHVVIKLGRFALVLESLHLPYHGHASTLDEALSQVVSLRNSTEQFLVKKGFGYHMV